ncbi:MAG: type II secretion system protein [Actinomycetota bacterium]|nr:type II secretion system protein [Actinomycetota bacterium]
MDGRRSGAEDGFTLIELVVALALFAILMAPLAEVFYTSIGTSSADRVRVVAIAMASRTSQQMASVPYASLGFYGDQAGFSTGWESGDATSDATPDSGNTVELSATTPAGTTPPVDPVSHTTQSGTTFTIQRFVTWADAVTGSGRLDEGAYKRTTVLVCWPATGTLPLSACTNSTSQVVPVQPGQHTVQIGSAVYPGGLGPYQGPG